MREWDKVYPEYGFAAHKGYGTAKHIAALKEYGPCEIHRRSFIKHFIKWFWIGDGSFFKKEPSPIQKGEEKYEYFRYNSQKKR